MNWKIIISLLALIFFAFVFEAFSKNAVEYLTTMEKDKMRNILKSARLTTTNKIKAIEKLNIQDTRVQHILTSTNKNGKPRSNMQKVIDLMELV